MNVAIILILLLGASGLAKLCGTETATAGRIGIAAVFVFTALGHFAKPNEMAAMLPAALPQRKALVFVSGFFELALAALVLLPAWSRQAGIAICLFLLLVTPVNVHAAIKKVNFGGHSAGPAYLAIRLPLQLLLVIWTYWFAVRAFS